MLKFKNDYSKSAAIGMAITCDHYDERQKIVDGLETVLESAEALKMYVDGQPFGQTIRRILSNLAHTAIADGVEVFMPVSGKVYGVKIKEPGKEPRWYTDRRYTYADAFELADHFQLYERNEFRIAHRLLYTVELIGEDEKY
jgi:hypothetical protein